MTRLFMGKDAAGTPLLRTSTPGNDAVSGLPHYLPSHGNQPPNEISFDSRWADWGRIHASGQRQGFGFVNFDALPFYPMVEVVMMDGSGFAHNDNLRRSINTYTDHHYQFPSFFLDVEKHRFEIIETINLQQTGLEYRDGTDCGSNPIFKYIVWDVKGFD